MTSPLFPTQKLNIQFSTSQKVKPMTTHFDDLSKSVAQSVTRRESLSRLGMLVTGAVLYPWASQTGWTAPRRGGTVDPCTAFCTCRAKKQKDQCLKACNGCNKDPSRLGGTCGNYFCCAEGQSACGSYCSDLKSDPSNCGSCGNACRPLGQYELAFCVNGQCQYECSEGTSYCDGVCTSLNNDPLNCGACGRVCDQATPYCSGGACWDDACGGADLNWDSSNCGQCGNVCPWGTACAGGVCEGICYNCY